MNQKFLDFFQMQYNNDSFDFEFKFNEITTNKEIFQLLKYFEIKIKYIANFENTKYSETFYNQYLQFWKILFEKYQFDELNIPICETYGMLFNFECNNPEHIYCYVNVSEVMKNKNSMLLTSINRLQTKNIVKPDRNIYKLQPVNHKNPIIIFDTIFEPNFHIVDGNHRYLNAIYQNSDLPVLVMPYQCIKKEFFINTFNYLLFMLVNEMNRTIMFITDGTEKLNTEINNSIQLINYNLGL